MNVIKPRGLCCDGVLVDNSLLRVAATVDADDAKDLITDLEPPGLCATFLDDAGNISPKRVRQPVILSPRDIFQSGS